MSRVKSLVAASLAALAFVSGAAGAAQQPAASLGSRSPSSRIVATPAVDTASRVAAPPIITFAGLGRAQIGLSMDRFAAALRWPLRLDESSGASSPCWVTQVGLDAAGVWVLTSRGRRGGVERVSVESQMGGRVDVRRAPRTAKGIGLGSTTRQVLVAYRGKVTATPHEYVGGGLYLDVAGAKGLAMRFETNARGRVTAIHAGRAAQVRWIEYCL